MDACGVRRFAVTSCTEGVDAADQSLFHDFVAKQHHGTMQYLERNDNLRFNPAELLPGAQSIIICAIPYYTPIPSGTLPIATYAWGDDYHTVLRRRLEQAVAQLRETLGGEYRICIDSAPVRERYWAAKAGLGFIGLNGHLIVPGCGSYVFLAEILSTVALPHGTTTPQPLPSSCGQCMRCITMCPAKALSPDGSLDARKCLSYLTIEHRGPFPPDTDTAGRLYGCDRCAQVCPHNSHPEPCSIQELMPRPDLLTITLTDILHMTPEQFSATFRNSPIKRIKLTGLQRNAQALLTPRND